jgi:hypothetical protein
MEYDSNQDSSFWKALPIETIKAPSLWLTLLATKSSAKERVFFYLPYPTGIGTRAYTGKETAMFRLSVLATLILAGTVSADELVLKDGKKIEWKTITDEGDTYEVTTPQGTKITVKKEGSVPEPVEIGAPP